MWAEFASKSWKILVFACSASTLIQLGTAHHVTFFQFKGALSHHYFCWFSILIPILLGSTVIFFEMEGLMMMFLSDMEGLFDLEG